MTAEEPVAGEPVKAVRSPGRPRDAAVTKQSSPPHS